MTDRSQGYASREQQVHEILAEYWKACDAGTAPRHDDILAQHPEFADQLREFFQHDDQWRRVSALPRSGDTTPTRVNGSTTTAPAPVLECSCGDYDLVEVIGRGGMGIVFKARQRRVDRIVALKMVLSGTLASRDELQRFRAEAEAAAHLDHPHIVPIYEVGEHDGRPYFTMKLVDGGTLAQRIADFRGQPRAAAQLLAQVARAVHHAHRHGVLHRDLKPGNILLGGQCSAVSGQSGTQPARSSPTDHWPLATAVPYVTDFGLAKRMEGDSSLTQSGAVVGTPNYMAPEQAAGSKQLTTAADTFSLGAILYELLTGVKPFQADTPMATLLRVQDQDPAKPRSIDGRIPADLETICLRCLEKVPLRRYPSTEQLAEDLGRWLAGEPIRARPARTGEILWKWMRRRPAVAALLGALIVTAALSVATIAWKWQEAERLRDLADSRNAQLSRALRQTELSLHNHQVALAEREWQQNKLGDALRMLDQCPKEFREWEWYFLHRLCQGDSIANVQFPDTMQTIVISHDGKRLALHGAKLWLADDTASQATSSTGLQGPFPKLAFSAHEKILYGYTSGSPLASWDIATMKRRDPDPELKNVQAIDAKGRYLARTVGKELMIRDLQEKNDVQKLPGPLQVICFSLDGRRFATIAAKHFAVWETHSGKKLAEFAGAAPLACALDTAGRRFAWAFEENVHVKDLDDPGRAITLGGHHGAVFALEFSPDGRLLASGGFDRGIHLWDTTAWKPLRTLRGHSGIVRGLAFHPDGERLVSVASEDKVRIWNLQRTSGSRLLTTTKGKAFSVTFGGNGRFLAFTSGPSVRVWNLQEDRSICDYSDGDTGHIAFRGDRPMIAYAVKSGVRVLDTTGGPTRLLKTGGVTSLAFARKGPWLAVGGKGGVVSLWNSETGDTGPNLERHAGTVNCVALNADGSHVASAGSDGTIILSDTASGRQLDVWNPGQDSIRSIAFHPDDSLLSAGSDGTVKIWNGTDRQPRIIQGQLPFGRIDIHPNGKRLAAVYGIDNFKIWDLETLQEVLTLRGKYTASDITFSPDGWCLATASDSEIKMWEAAP